MLPLVPQLLLCTPVTLIMLKVFTPSRPILANLPCPRQVLINENTEINKTTSLPLNVVGEVHSDV